MAEVVFPFPFPENLELILPEIILAVMGMVVLLMSVFLSVSRQNIVAGVSIATVIAVGASVLYVSGSDASTTFYGYFVLDPFAVYAKLLIAIATVFAMMLSLNYVKDEANVGEYYTIMLFASLGMMLMVSATNFVTMYLGLELMALSVYVLVGYQRDVLRSTEAALKYFILGALSSCMLLYGLTFLYGSTGSFIFTEMGDIISNSGEDQRLAVLTGMLFVLAGLSFKVSVAPFHMWTPDAYEGAPTPITAFMSVAPKVAGLVVFMRILVDVFPGLQAEYTTILMFLAVLSMAVGNIAAIAQRNIKRMLAYSTIGHIGFILLGLIAGSNDGYAGILIYMTIYLFMTMGVFAIIIMMRRDEIQGELLDDFAGLSRVRPGYALAMGLLMFSMAGIPFLGGFWAKYAVFIAVIEADHIILATLGVLFSAIGAFYYIRIVKYMYFDEERVSFNFAKSAPLQVIVVLTTLVIVAIGIYPEPVMAMCRLALAGLV
ncbi:MAG: NADH-quinone oxidoreductase subunit N [Zetaproteobacteria bacterium CG2_30_46_52]|nr:MAG: NADH-quinone oxidoreductase subunit N [Zetaproteobacteria bacterium CG2_30_46_52]